MKKKLVGRNVSIVYVPFTGVGIPGYRGDVWFRDRIEIFKRFTLQSLKSQSKQDFLVWVSFRSQERDNPLLEILEESFSRAHVKYVFTFDGLMYHDDKFGGSFLKRAKNIGRLLRYCWRRKIFDIDLFLQIWNDKNKSLQQRLSNSLRVVFPFVGAVDWIYMTRLDSDDMLSRCALLNISSVSPRRQSIILNHGYIYNATTDEVASYEPKTNPPFYTIVFDGKSFFSPEKHVEYYGGFESHEDIPKVFPVLTVEGSYCVTIHNPKNQISTTWDHPFRRRIIRNNILDVFGR